MTTRREFLQTASTILALSATGLTGTISATEKPLTGLQLRSTVKSSGVLEISLVPVKIPSPEKDEIVVRIEGTPINPSDMLSLFGAADLSTARVSGSGKNTVLTADIPKNLLPFAANRLDKSLPVGLEGAGVVIDAGSSDASKALLGRTVAMQAGAMFSQYRVAKAEDVMVMPKGTTPQEAAASFVNPLTTLCMLETMRMEGHKAIVHTAAASNLGQMLVKLCIEDKVPLVNIVRRQEQVDLLKGLGAEYVVNSSLPTFMDDLTKAVSETGATLGFDPVGGGMLADQILTAMERAAIQSGGARTPYGTSVRKQVYIYGALDRSNTVLTRNYGVNWDVGIWLMPMILQKIGAEAAQKLKEKVAAEIKTTFASSYAKVVSFSEALQPAAIAVYSKQHTGEKYLINPNEAL